MPFLFSFFLLFSSALLCLGQNDIIKTPVMSVPSIKKSAGNNQSSSTTDTGKTVREAPKVVRPFYINTIISVTDSLEEHRLIKIVGDNLSEEGFHFEVRNRWDNFVYESRSLNEMMSRGWNGTHNDTPLQAGYYSFSVRYRDNNGNSFEKKGFITIDP